MLDTEQIKKMKLPELQEHAAKMGIPRYRYMKKGELQQLLLKSFAGDPASAPSSEPAASSAPAEKPSPQPKEPAAQPAPERAGGDKPPMTEGQLKALKAQQEMARRRMEQQKQQQQQQSLSSSGVSPQPADKRAGTGRTVGQNAPGQGAGQSSGNRPNYFAADYEFEGLIECEGVVEIGGGVSINKTKLQAFDAIIDETELLNGKYILVQKGKKNYFLLIAK